MLLAEHVDLNSFTILLGCWNVPNSNSMFFGFA